MSRSNVRSFIRLIEQIGYIRDAGTGRVDMRVGSGRIGPGRVKIFVNYGE